MLLIGIGLHGKGRTCPEKGQSAQKPWTVWDRLQVICVRYRTDCTRRLGGKGQRTQKPWTVWDRLQAICVRYKTDCTRRLGGKGQSTLKPWTEWDRLQVTCVRYRTDCTRRLGGKGQGAPDLSVRPHVRPTLNEKNEEVNET